MKEIINICPVCGDKLVATTLKCLSCDIEIKGEFEIPKKEANKETILFEEDTEFIKAFLKNEGNIKKTGDELGLDYFEMKDRLNALNIKLGNKEMTDENESSDYLPSLTTDGKGKASQKIIECLNECHGTALCGMLKGDDIRIWLTQNGVVTSSVKDYVYKWEEFDAIVEKAKSLGGKMYRGDSAAQKGEKIGSDAFPIDTIDAFIGINFYGQKEGETAFRRSTYFASVLQWAGICTNHRSDGIGGYIVLNPEWR